MSAPGINSRRHGGGRPGLAALIGLLTLMALASAAAAEEEPRFQPYRLEVSPTWLGGGDLDQFTLGLGFAAEAGKLLSRTQWQGWPLWWLARVQAAGTLALNPDLNPQPLTADLEAAVRLNFYRPGRQVLRPGMDPDAVPRREDLDLGALQAAVSLGYETDQRGREMNAALGAYLGYVKDREDGAWFLVPSLWAALDGVWVLDSRERDRLGDASDDYLRLRLAAAWKWRFGEVLHQAGAPAWLAPLGLHLDARYFRELDPDPAWEAAGREESTYLSGAVSYTISTKLIRRIFFRVSEGRIPPETENRTTYLLGVEVPLGQITGLAATPGGAP